MPRKKTTTKKPTTPVTETTVVLSEETPHTPPTAETCTEMTETAPPQAQDTAHREAVLLDSAQAIMSLAAQGPEALLAALRSGQLRWRLDTGKGLGGRKLSKDDYPVIRARAKAGEGMKTIAADFGISPRYCRSIVIARRGAGGTMRMVPPLFCSARAWSDNDSDSVYQRH